MDETYVKVGGQWKYLLRAVDKHGRLIDFLLTVAATLERPIASWKSVEGHATLGAVIKADHGALKQVIRPTRGFQTMKTAFATIKGLEVMRMIRRGHCLTGKPHVKDEVRAGAHITPLLPFFV